jgi:hypothetical protein
MLSGSARRYWLVAAEREEMLRCERRRLDPTHIRCVLSSSSIVPFTLSQAGGIPKEEWGGRRPPEPTG